MMNLLILFLFSASLAFSQGREVGAGVRRYNGYKVYSVEATSKEQFQPLWDYYTDVNSVGGVDFWTKPVFNGKTDVMIDPEDESHFLSFLENNGIKYTVKIDDVQSLIDVEKAESEQAKLRSGGSKRLSWDSYARYSDMEAFLQEVAQMNNGVASVESIGKSYEGRDIYAVKISTSPNNKKAILIDANIHAREWITSATATWIINEFVTKTDQYRASHLDGINYYIIPNVNPDGYEYAHTTDRMWRKTRSNNFGSRCKGCDPNRNFPWFYGGEGTSSNPCSETYKGKSALSEKETKAVAQYIQRLQDSGDNLLAYVSFHSYGQLWLLPWGYTAGEYPSDYADQLSLGTEVIKAIREVHGSRYTTGTGADVLYGVGGASDDYAKSVGIKYTVTAEMRDEGRSGFILPPSQIIANAEEVMVGMAVVASRVRAEA